MEPRSINESINDLPKTNVKHSINTYNHLKNKSVSFIEPNVDKYYTKRRRRKRSQFYESVYFSNNKTMDKQSTHSLPHTSDIAPNITVRSKYIYKHSYKLMNYIYNM